MGNTITRKKAKTTTMEEVVDLERIAEFEDRNAVFKLITRVDIPDGYTFKADDTADCNECAFLSVAGCESSKDLSCTHPTPTKTGCADNNIIFVRI